MDPEWICASCKDGRHGDCDFWRACECAVRLGPDGHGVWLCESLTGFSPLLPRQIKPEAS